MRHFAATIVLALTVFGLAHAEPQNREYIGELAPGDSVMRSDNSLFDSYPLKLEAGWRVEARVTSPDFDTVLFLIREGSSSPIFQNDDCHHPTIEVVNPTDSCVDYQVPSAGNYTLLINGLNKAHLGRYRLEIRIHQGE